MTPKHIHDPSFTICASYTPLIGALVPGRRMSPALTIAVSPKIGAPLSHLRRVVEIAVVAAHRAIAQQIMRTLNRDGYWSKKQLEVNERIKSRKHHGFDMGKLVPSSLFYLPCQARDPANSFFIDHDAPGRVPIDPYVWAGYAANHHRPAPEPVEVVPTNVRTAQPGTHRPSVQSSS